MSVVKYEIQQKDLIIYYDDFRIKKTIINYTSKDLEIVLLKCLKWAIIQKNIDDEKKFLIELLVLKTENANALKLENTTLRKLRSKYLTLLINEKKQESQQDFSTPSKNKDHEIIIKGPKKTKEKYELPPITSTEAVFCSY